MSREILEDIISDFKIEKFIRFFRQKNRYFRPQRESLNEYDDNDFSGSLKLGEIKFDNEAQNLIICSFISTNSLSEKSGKKAQYEKAKKLLKELCFDAGIFIFYDLNNNFRFSLIYSNYMGTRRDWSTFRRFTYFVSPDLTNKTFLQRIGESDFLSLEKIKDAFSVEKVTEDFYKDIANWYFWAVQNSIFPRDAEVEENGRNMAIIRLITRLIFIWFMRVRGLVPDYFFNKNKLVEFLSDFSSKSSSYYKAILQNLFFATLSTKREERNFRSEIRGIRGYNPDFGNQYTYRYHKLFKNSENIKDYFGEIPFLNGGIFECLDDKPNGIYIDGFSDTKKNQPIVPNFLFFSGERNADLNIEYGTKNKNYKVRGIINTLSYYNFTIDENDPHDAEVALDPELLGKVFENLLASFNPETATTARKATGSFYTPREIVDFMVLESLKEYFKTHLNNQELLENRLDILFNIEDDKNPFNVQESKKVVELIDKLRIVDPAVGSGAFPMSILNKLVYILSKLDPQNLLWKQAQLDVVQNIPDPKSRKDAIDNIEKNFMEKNVNYFRKLYLIQKCIYGVDIQQIAVEIAKLRFFISLLVDEKIDKNNKDSNWGIEPLPNLDFKIMQGNSLISEFLGVDFDNDLINQNNKMQQDFGFKEEDDSLIRHFEQRKIDYQNETDRNKKNELQNKIENLMVKIFEAKLQKKYTEINSIIEKAQQIPNLKNRDELIKKEKTNFYKKLGFDLSNIDKQFKEFSSKKKKRPFFAWKLYFAEVFRGDNPGFDIVIANPPYGFRNILTAKEKKYFRKEKSINFPSGDIAELFIYISFDKLVRSEGIQTFIIPKKSLYGESWKNVRKYWISNNLHYLMDASKAFKNVLLEQVSFSISKKSNLKSKIKVGMLNSKDNRIEIFDSFCLNEIFSQDLRNAQIYRGLYPKAMMEKISSNSKRDTSDMIKAEIGISNITKYLTFNKNNNYPCVKGIDIIRYGLKNERYLKGKIANRYLNSYLGNKIIAQEIVAHVQNPFPHIIITMFYDDNNRLLNDTCVEIKVLDSRLSRKFLLGYIQSSFCNWYAYNLIYNRAIRTMHFIDYYVSQIPVPQKIISEPEKQTPIIEIVDKILITTKSNDYLENQSKKDRVKKYEDEINQVVYQLYNLTEEEINILENK